MMIARIIQWSLGNRLFVLVGAALLLFWGGWETSRMPVDVFPDLTAPQVTVVTEAHGMAPTEVETLVTFPIETALNGAPGVRRVRSTTDVGISVVVVEFEWGADIYQARQIVAEKVQLARANLPPDLPAPTLAPVSSVMGEILFIALNSKQHTSMELKSAADWVVRTRLLAVPGVAEVVPIGGDTKQFQVVVKPERLAAYGITLDEVVQAVKRTNQNASAGFYTEGGQEYLIHGVGRVRSPQDIGETAVAKRGDLTVRVRDLAEVAIGAAAKRGTGAHNGNPAVVLGIQKQPGVNTLGLDAAAGCDAGRHPALIAQGHGDPDAALSSGGFHRGLDRQPAGGAARRCNSGSGNRLCVSHVGPFDRDRPAGDSTLAGGRGTVDESTRRDHQHHDPRRHGDCARRPC